MRHENTNTEIAIEDYFFVSSEKIIELFKIIKNKSFKLNSEQKAIFIYHYRAFFMMKIISCVSQILGLRVSKKNVVLDGAEDGT